MTIGYMFISMVYCRLDSSLPLEENSFNLNCKLNLIHCKMYHIESQKAVSLQFGFQIVQIIKYVNCREKYDGIVYFVSIRPCVTHREFVVLR
jgi:hypothetical protein